MPTLTICPVPHCGAITTGGRCPQHRTHNRPTTQPYRRRRAIYDTQAWRRLSKNLRTNNACERCGTTEDLTVHHTLGLDPAVAYDPDSMIVLCRDCHGTIQPHRNSPRNSPPPTGIEDIPPVEPWCI